MTSASRLLAAGLLAAVLVRGLLAILPAGVPLETKVVHSVSDAAEYLALGSSLAFHRSFALDPGPLARPELFRTPGWPMLLAPLFRFFANPLPAVIALQALLSVLLVIATFRFACRLGLEPRHAGLAALFVGLSPNLAFLATKAVSETLFTVLLLTCLLLFQRWRESGRAREAVACGVAAGLLVLVRPIALFFPLLLSLLALLLSGFRTLHRVVHALLLLACAALAVLPWVTRNARASGRWVVSTAGEHNLFLYNGATALAAARGIGIEAARDSMRQEAESRFGPLDPADEVGFWRALGRIGAETVLRHPGPALVSQFGGLVGCFAGPLSLGPLLVHAGKPPSRDRVWQAALAMAARGRPTAALKLVRESRLAGAGTFATTVLVISSLFLLGLVTLAVAGLARCRELRWLVAPILYFTVLAGPVGEARFRAPVEPILCLLAAAALARRPAAGSRRRHQA
ncbi:glycosyltransferase family 39 protein [candidate division WOR-3 bacterium]|nr:glycosyltransferase family 39 protein [candidate division WOR-3 bacterium]